MHTLPEAFIKQLKGIIPPSQWEQVIASFTLTRPTSFRCNTLKNTSAQLIKELDDDGLTVTPLSGIKNAFTIPATQHQILTHSNAFQEGRLYIQQISSMLPALILNPQPHEEILDLTAAPGSKTCQIACLMNNSGRIAAVEKVKSRFFKLKDNLERQGVGCVDTYLKDGSLVWKSCPDRFDRVLLDAPCSSTGRFDSNNPKSLQYWSENKTNEMARKQKRLLYSAFASLKPGGTLVYSTCTFSVEENELQIAKLMKRFKEKIKIVPISLPIKNTQQGITKWRGKELPHELSHCLRILPNDMMTGFFICQLLRSNSR